MKDHNNEAKVTISAYGDYFIVRYFGSEIQVRYTELAANQDMRYDTQYLRKLATMVNAGSAVPMEVTDEAKELAYRTEIHHETVYGDKWDQAWDTTLSPATN